MTSVPCDVTISDDDELRRLMGHTGDVFNDIAEASLFPDLHCPNQCIDIRIGQSSPAVLAYTAPLTVFEDDDVTVKELPQVVFPVNTFKPHIISEGTPHYNSNPRLKSKS